MKGWEEGRGAEMVCFHMKHPPIAVLKLLAAASVEGDPGRVATLRWNGYLFCLQRKSSGSKKIAKNRRVEAKVKPKDFKFKNKAYFKKATRYLEFNSSWNNDRPEWEWMWADGSHHDGRYTWVNHGCTGSNSVSSWSSGSRNNQTIALHGRYVFAIKIEVDIGQVRRWAAIDHHLIEYKQAQWSFSSFTRRFVFTHDDATQTASQCQRCVTYPNKSNIKVRISNSTSIRTDKIFNRNKNAGKVTGTHT